MATRVSPWFMVPHDVTQTTARVWVCWSKRVFPNYGRLDLRLTPTRGDAVVVPLATKWKGAPAPQPDSKGHPNIRFHHQWVDVSGLSPGTEYKVELVSRGGSQRLIRQAVVVETLPSGLPAASAQRPFTMLLGSRYWREIDKGRVGRAFEELYARKMERPHLKLLMGDQVYLDSPWQEYLLRESTNWLKAKFSESYLNSWHGLRPMLDKGVNYFTADDHEFWNNYSPKPAAAWKSLNSSEAYRTTHGRLAREMNTAIQGGRTFRTFSVGDLSVAVVDTRINRKAVPTRFMSAGDMTKLGKWVSALKGPGVVGLGRPVIDDTAAKHVIAGYTDYKLPYFAQYRDLAQTLGRSRHDIVVLAPPQRADRDSRGRSAELPRP